MGSISPPPRELAAQRRRDIRGLLIITAIGLHMLLAIVVVATAGVEGLVTVAAGLLVIAVLALLLRLVTDPGPLTVARVALGVFIGVVAAALFLAVISFLVSALAMNPAFWEGLRSGLGR